MWHDGSMHKDGHVSACSGEVIWLFGASDLDVPQTACSLFAVMLCSSVSFLAVLSDVHVNFAGEVLRKKNLPFQ